MQDDPPNAPTPPDPLPPLSEAHEELPKGSPANPAWASDLRQLYNAVVEEPLPDSFLALLSQLDSED